jgi:alpha-glutamyl/putrescinyl thymine pyrophosphorylase clade 1
LNHVCDVILELDPNDAPTTNGDRLFQHHKDCCGALKELPGVGNFFAWQIFSDLQEAGCIAVHPLSNPGSAPYVLLGPGASRGLHHIFGSSKSKPNCSKQEQIRQIHSLIKYQGPVYDALGMRFDYWNGELLSVKEYEYVGCCCVCVCAVLVYFVSRCGNPRHALCEYFKYCRIVQQRKTNRACPNRRPYVPTEHECSQCATMEGPWGCLCDACGTHTCATCTVAQTKPSTQRTLCGPCQEFEHTIRYEVTHMDAV